MVLRQKEMKKNSIQFAHPNGFPAKCFNHLFNSIDNADINYVNLMGHDRFKIIGNLENLALELIDSIEKKFTTPVIGIGHSTGGTLILIAASIKPELFEKVILIDPILYNPWKRRIIKAMKIIGLKNYIGPVKRTLKRKSFFQSLNNAKEHFKTKKLFQHFNKHCFSDYLKYGLKKRKNGFELAFSKEIEAEIYRSTYTKLPKGISKLKGTLIYGNKSTLFKKSDVNWWKNSFPNFNTIAFDGGHLFPLEKPTQTAEMINKILNN